MPLDSAYHAPVLASDVTELLRHSKRVLDCTLGGGGHSLALLEAGVESLVGVDRDPQALAAASERLAQYAELGRFSSVEANFATIDNLPALEGIRFDGILLDLGISSHQIDVDDRGFTFRPGRRLDMRMGDDAPMDAAELLNSEDEQTLTSIFTHLWRRATRVTSRPRDCPASGDGAVRDERSSCRRDSSRARTTQWTRRVCASVPGRAYRRQR